MQCKKGLQRVGKILVLGYRKENPRYDVTLHEYVFVLEATSVKNNDQLGSNVFYFFILVV